MARVLMKGCEAIAEAAVRAGCRFFAGGSFLLPIHGLLTLLSRTGLLRGDVYEHLLSFKRWHVLYLADLFQVIGKPEQQHFSLFLKKNGTTFEEYVSFNFISILQLSLIHI